MKHHWANKVPSGYTTQLYISRLIFDMLTRMFRLHVQLQHMGKHATKSGQNTSWVSQYYFSKQRAMQTPAATEALLQNEIPKYFNIWTKS